MYKNVLTPINQAGWPFIGIFVAITIGFFMVSETLGWFGVISTLWCIYFFRDPDRIPPTRDGLVICPADGVVQLIDCAVPPSELEMGTEALPRICIFMNVFDVHVNRVPMDGVIKKISYRPGRFFNASLDKASDFNERLSLLMKTNENHEIAFVQIAGLIARRIKCDLIEKQKVKAGQRFGLIRFGSRVDVYLPKNTQPLVCMGQRTIAAETILADVNTSESSRIGEVR